jgi:hypothetical protein
MTQNNKDLHEVEDPDVKYYEPKPEGEKQFWKRHLVQKHADRNGNKDDVFGATNINKDDTTLPHHKDDLGTPIGNRPADQLKKEKGIKEEKMTSGEKSKREEIVKAMKKKTAGFKERYGDRWKDVMYATATKSAMGEEVELEEDSQAATSDNPAGAQNTVGQVDNNNSHLNNNPTADQPNKGEVKNTLEQIAMQAAEMHDQLEDGQEVDSGVLAAISEAKDALEQAYESINQNGKNVKEEAEELEEISAAFYAAAARGAKRATRANYGAGGRDNFNASPKLKIYRDPTPQPKPDVKEDFEEVDDVEDLFEELQALEEATVKDKTGTIVGTHKPGEGFKPNALGKRLGHKAHPTDVPSGTTITKRGRPTGAKSFGASKRKGETSAEAGGASEKPSFTDHLLKAADSRTGGHVTFDNGKSHHVPRVHAINALYHMGKPEKPDDKNKVRKHIGASKENFDSFRKSGGKLPAEAPKYDPDARIKARTSQITTRKTRSAAHAALAQKILAKRKAGK